MTTFATGLYEAHRDYVLAVLARRCSWLGPDEREEVLHDAYVVLLEKRRDERLDVDAMCERQVRAYVTQTAINKAFDQGKRVERTRCVRLDDESVAVALRDCAPDPAERVEARDAMTRLGRVIAQLPERQQKVVGLRYLLQCTPLEIQGRMGISERTYRRLLEHARKAIFARRDLHPAFEAPVPSARRPRARKGRAWHLAQSA